MKKTNKRQFPGRPPVETGVRRVVLTLTVSPEFKAWLRAESRARGLSAGRLVETLAGMGEKL